MASARHLTSIGLARTGSRFMKRGLRNGQIERAPKRAGVAQRNPVASSPTASASPTVSKLLDSAARLSGRVSAMSFSMPVAYVYNTFDYAFEGYADYTRRYAGLGCEVLLVGMNPGPFGMAQTGVPFGDVPNVSGWMGLKDWAGTPGVELPEQHPKRPLMGHKCMQVERSGERLWSLAKNRWDSPESFFSQFWVYNYCPLVFMSATGANVTPDKLKGPVAAELADACDAALEEVIEALQPKAVIGIGKFAEKCICRCLKSRHGITTGSILHPSPASPAGNGLGVWEAKAAEQLDKIGICLPDRRPDAVSIK